MAKRKRGLTREQFDGIPTVIEDLQRKKREAELKYGPLSDEERLRGYDVEKHAKALMDKFGTAALYAFAISSDHVEAALQDLDGVTNDDLAFEILCNHVNPTIRN